MPTDKAYYFGILKQCLCSGHLSGLTGMTASCKPVPPHENHAGQQAFPPMKLRLMVISLLFVLYFPRADARGQSVRSIKIIDYGIYRAKILKKTPAEKTAAGYWNEIETNGIAIRTTDIPGSLGTRFGILYIVEGEPLGEIVCLQKITIYPGLKNRAKNDVVYRSDYGVEAAIGIPRYSGYGFDHEWEVVPGKWTIQLCHKGKKLAEKTFLVQRPRLTK